MKRKTSQGLMYKLWSSKDRCKKI